MAASYSPSAAMLRTARNEIQRVERALSVIDHRRSALLAQVASLDREADEHRRRRDLLRELLEVEEAIPTAGAGAGVVSVPARAVKGRELRREAGRLLWRWKRGEAVHYREWFERVLAAGYAVGGKDPAASFLTNVRDSPAVLGAGRQGHYRLDPACVERLRDETGEAQAELEDVERSIARAYEEGHDAERLRGHRDALKQRLRRLLADSDEVGYVFGGEDADEVQSPAGAPSLRAA